MEIFPILTPHVDSDNRSRMSRMRANLQLVSSEVPDEEIYRHVANIKQLLHSEPSIEVLSATKPESASEGHEEKSDVVSLSALAMAFISGGAAGALINAIRATSQSARDSEIEYSIDLGDDTGKLELKAKNLTAQQTTDIIGRWDQLLAALSAKSTK